MNELNGLKASSSGVNLHRWGAIAFFALAASFIVSAALYLTGNLRDPLGPFLYDLADFLSGPLWAASLVTALLALRARLGARAPTRMQLAFLTSLLAAAAMLTVATVRAANRHYHLAHPELNLEQSAQVLAVWTTLISGLTAAGFHFLGWAWLLTASAAWSSRGLPTPSSVIVGDPARGARSEATIAEYPFGKQSPPPPVAVSHAAPAPRMPFVLILLYLVAGLASLFVYLGPNIEGMAVFFSVQVCLWQAFLLWKAGLPG
jgi:hypothetical protein